MEDKFFARCGIIVFVLNIFVVVYCRGQQVDDYASRANINIGKNIASPCLLRLYKYNRQNHCDQSRNLMLIYNNKISSCFTFVKDIDEKDSQRLVNILNSADTYGGEQLSCFDTDYALLVMNGKTIVGYISLSFSCNTSMAVPSIKSQYRHKKGELAKVGFSSSGRAKIINILKI